ncbi:MAG TPA: 30S ribosomal protein S16, partial [Longimicrobium sp.]|nr:30S ribosomal protein S16 [Longimicrobium sp.]
MALKIRLRRMGRKKAPHYRIVIAESTMPRDGRFVATIGHYNPTTEPTTLKVDAEKAHYWLGRGATPTDTVGSLLKKAGVFAPAPSAVEAVAGAVSGAAGKA